MAPAKRPPAGQEALFEVPGGKTPHAREKLPASPLPMGWKDGIRPWDPIDQADTQVGWQYPWVTPRRAVEIRQEIEHG